MQNARGQQFCQLVGISHFINKHENRVFFVKLVFANGVNDNLTDGDGDSTSKLYAD